MRRELRGRVIDPDGDVTAATVTIDGRRIAAVDVGGAHRGPLLVPGFVDLQVNGIDDVDCRHADAAGWDRLDELLAAQGTTAWCPTLITGPLASYARPLESIREALARDAAARPTLLGAHLEGPFLGGSPGAHDPHHVIAADLAWIGALGASVRLVTLAPECVGVEQAIATLRDKGIVVSLGHTSATHDQIDAAVEAGAALVTHLFNGMPAMHHRRPSVAGHALADDRLTASIIADGVHVDMRLVKTAFRAKGRGRIILVTDSVAWREAGHVAAGVRIVDGVPRLPDGTIAGSDLTMIEAVGRVVDAGIPIGDALTAASHTPARLVGHTGGTLDVGADADIAVVDDDAWVVRETIVAGVTAYTA